MVLTFPKPLSRSIIDLSSLKSRHRGVPSFVKVTQWGIPLTLAKHVVFYFGGMPASAEEPALHSVTAGNDVYSSRNIHLICIDKPGMGGTSVSYWHSIRRDWPRVVASVADLLTIPGSYTVMGMSNGGPYVMACLTHPDLKHRVKAGCMVVGTSDVWASGYFSWRHPSGLLEGLYNSLPVVITGPLTALLLKVGSHYLFQFGGYQSNLTHVNYHSDKVQTAVKTLLQDGGTNFGIGAAMDCQQGLSPLFANHISTTIEAYSNINVPLIMWYGTKDRSVPMSTAEWLHALVPKAILQKVDGGHGLYFDHAEEILDNLVSKLEEE